MLILQFFCRSAETALRQVAVAWILGEDAAAPMRAPHNDLLRHLHTTAESANTTLNMQLAQFRFNEALEESDFCNRTHSLHYPTRYPQIPQYESGQERQGAKRGG